MISEEFISNLKVKFNSFISSVSKELDEYGVIYVFTGTVDDDYLDISIQDDEVIVSTRQCHWHSPLNSIDAFTEETIENLFFDIVNGKIISYSAWINSRATGSGSIYGSLDEAYKICFEHFLNATHYEIKAWGAKVETRQNAREWPEGSTSKLVTIAEFKAHMDNSLLNWASEEEERERNSLL